MKILIVDDDLVSRKELKKFMTKHGECEVAVNGVEVLESFLTAHKVDEPFELICLDIMMPKLDGIRVLQAIRDYEEQKFIDLKDRAKVIMTTALNDKKTVMETYEIGCDAYTWKPLDLEKTEEILKSLNLIES